jgi:membrane fusion protein (multidrug efflux system)
MSINRKSIIIFSILIGAGIIGLFIYHKSAQDTSVEPSALVSLAPVQSMPINKSLSTYGTVDFSPEYSKQLTVQNEALIVHVFVVQGQRVKKDDPLLQLAPSANANLNMKNANLEVNFAKKEVERLTKLRSQFLATNAEVQTATQNLAKAEAALNNLNTQQQNEAGKVFRATEDATVITVNVQPGQIANASSTLLTLGDQNHVSIKLGVEDEDLSSVQIGQPVTITPLYKQAKSFTGSVTRITGVIDLTTGLVNVIVPIDNAAELIPGSLVHGEITIQQKAAALTVPRNAVLYNNDKAYVYVANNGKAEQRMVTVGDDNGKYVEVSKGLAPNEKVVVLGNYELQNGMALRMEQP